MVESYCTKCSKLVDMSGRCSKDCIEHCHCPTENERNTEMSADNGWVIQKRESDGQFTLQHYFASGDGLPNPEESEMVFKSLEMAVTHFSKMKDDSEYGLRIEIPEAVAVDELEKMEMKLEALEEEVSVLPMLPDDCSWQCIHGSWFVVNRDSGVVIGAVMEEDLSRNLFCRHRGFLAWVCINGDEQVLGVHEAEESAQMAVAWVLSFIY